MSGLYLYALLPDDPGLRRGGVARAAAGAARGGDPAGHAETADAEDAASGEGRALGSNYGERRAAETDGVSALGRGVAGEPVRLVRAGGLVAVAGTVAATPEVDLERLRAHDAVVRRVAAHARAILPLRFGQLVAGERALAEHVERHLPRLRAALAEVEGCEQTTLRVYAAGAARDGCAADERATTVERAADVRAADEHPTDKQAGGEHATDEHAADVRATLARAAGAPGATATASGPGTRYLAAQLARLHPAPPAALAPALARVAPLVRAERVERHDREPLLASVYHLVCREDRERYDHELAAALAPLVDLHVQVTGPFPPYAFASGFPA